MGKFCVTISIVCFVVFAFHAQAQAEHSYGGPKDGNVITDSTIMPRVLSEEIPKSVIAFDLHILKNLFHQEYPTENVFYSPMCGYATLLMHLRALPKEHQETLKEILNITDRYGDVYGSGFEELSKRIEHEGGEGQSHHSRSGADIANAFFVQKDNSVVKFNYKSIKDRDYHDAKFLDVDFVAGSGAEVTSTINSFIAEHTKNHIEQFYTRHVSTDTLVVAVHTLNFHGVWEKTFPKEHTQTGKFHTGDGGEIDVPMMHDQELVSHTHSDILQFDAIELPYKGGEFCMYVVLPRHSQTIKNLTEYSDWYDLHEIRRNTRSLRVDYKIPKMKFSGSNSFVKMLELKDVLGGMGAHHVVEVDINEEGTMATAATAVGNKRPHVWSETHGVSGHLSQSSSGLLTQFWVDRPFGMAIVHKPTHMVLFQGVVLKP